MSKYTVHYYYHYYTHTSKGLKRAYLQKVLTNTLHMAATLNGNTLVLQWSSGTTDGGIVWFIDGDDDITSAKYDCAFGFENAES